MAAASLASRRLSERDLPVIRQVARVPRERPRSISIVHLGIGAFHRAHQAVFTEDAADATGDDSWGICGVTQRSAEVLGQLRPQDCLYTVIERGRGVDEDLRVVGQVSDVLYAADESKRLQTLLGDPAVRLVTLTVTEKGYRRNASGGLDLGDPSIAADLAGARSSILGQLVGGLEDRVRRDAGPITVLSCDNLMSNGRVLEQLILEFCAAMPSPHGQAVGRWIQDHVTFPSSMVDRIVPATTSSDRALVSRRLGVDDTAAVVAEPFKQWVIEDRFANGRPRWELAGADLVADVRPYEALKLRTLNATHSMLAYLGALRGHDTIAEATSDPELVLAARRFIRDDVAPALTDPPADVVAYGEQALERFANPALKHRTTQVAMDGSLKLPLRILPTVRDRFLAGGRAEWAALAVAGWMAYVARGRDMHGRLLPLEDPIADRLRMACGARTGAAVIVDGLLGIDEVFGPDLRDCSGFRDDVVAHVKALL